MEYLDVLDEKGNKTGLIKSKDEVHVLGLWHRTVHVWLVNFKNEILFQLRSKDKISYPNTWDVSVAGHISAGEESLESAVRESEEELGIVIEKDDLKFISTVINCSILNGGTFIDNQFNDIYLLKTDLKIEDFRFSDGEVEKVEYISLDTFKKWVKDGKTDLQPRSEEYELLSNYLK
ncbi:MAG: NUDIX domain-containing protein [Patescibacteria group bacterium]